MFEIIGMITFYIFVILVSYLAIRVICVLLYSYLYKKDYGLIWIKEYKKDEYLVGYLNGHLGFNLISFCSENINNEDKEKIMKKYKYVVNFNNDYFNKAIEAIKNDKKVFKNKKI